MGSFASLRFRTSPNISFNVRRGQTHVEAECAGEFYSEQKVIVNYNMTSIDYFGNVATAHVNRQSISFNLVDS